MSTSDDADAVVRERIQTYVRHFEYRRQIHSNKALRLERSGRGLVIITILIATAVAFIGFTGTDTLRALLAGWHRFAPDTITFMYNSVVLAILLVTIHGLVYRFDERATRHRSAIERLTAFIRDAEDAIALSEAGAAPLTIPVLDTYRERYKGIVDGLPPTTDREFAKAKRDLAKKQGEPRPVAAPRWVPEGPGIEPALGHRLAELMVATTHRPVLEGVHEALGPEAWVTGGFVRDAVWDDVHRYKIPTPLDDVDVIYFNRSTRDKATDERMERTLAGLSGNIRWSVKNQARMHVITGDQPYASLRDAVSHAPETATAVAVRIDSDGTLHMLAPHGLLHLFEGIVKPTPGFDLDRYEKRAAVKDWSARWPNLRVWHRRALD